MAGQLKLKFKGKYKMPKESLVKAVALISAIALILGLLLYFSFEKTQIQRGIGMLLVTFSLWPLIGFGGSYLLSKYIDYVEYSLYPDHIILKYVFSNSLIDLTMNFVTIWLQFIARSSPAKVSFENVNKVETKTIGNGEEMILTFRRDLRSTFYNKFNIFLPEKDGGKIVKQIQQLIIANGGKLNG